MTYWIPQQVNSQVIWFFFSLVLCDKRLRPQRTFYSWKRHRDKQSETSQPCRDQNEKRVSFITLSFSPPLWLQRWRTSSGTNFGDTWQASRVRGDRADLLSFKWCTGACKELRKKKLSSWNEDEEIKTPFVRRREGGERERENEFPIISSVSCMNFIRYSLNYNCQLIQMMMFVTFSSL